MEANSSPTISNGGTIDAGIAAQMTMLMMESCTVYKDGKMSLGREVKEYLERSGMLRNFGMDSRLKRKSLAI